jgi:hypothetical protein
MDNTLQLKTKLAFVLFPMWLIIFTTSWLVLIPYGLTLKYLIPPFGLASLMTLSGVMSIKLEDNFNTVADVINARKGIIIMFIFLVRPQNLWVKKGLQLSEPRPA